MAITMGQIRAGGAPGGGGRGAASNLQNAGAASAELTAAMAQGNLKKANEIVTAMRQAQAEAKLAATGKLPDGSSIPNGLKPGGLEPHNPTGAVASGNVPVTWSGVSSLAETRANPSDSAAATVHITQNQQNAYLYWNKFNVGPKTTVNFDLAENLKANPGQNIAFNKITGTASPSHIFGKINAQGQVYVLNQNGIMFHNGSEVNVHSLVASTLPINPYFAGDPMKGITGVGLLNNPGYQFLFSAATLGASKSGADKFDPLSATVAAKALAGDTTLKVSRGSSYTKGDILTGEGIASGTEVRGVSRSGADYDEVTLTKAAIADISSGASISGTIAARNIGGVVVERGAVISSPVSSDNTGGRVALVGSSVANAGTISTPSGQAILAAGLQVGMAAHPSSDPSLRGLDIYVGKVADAAGGNTDSSLKLSPNGLIDSTVPTGNAIGTVINAGAINISRGAASLVGASIKHSGVIDSSTSVSLNGRVDIQATFNAAVSANSIGSPYYYDHTVAGGTTGTVEIGRESLIRILPEWGSTETAPGSSLALPSLVSFLGQQVNLDTRSMIIAPGAKVDSSASFLDMTSAVRGVVASTLPAGVSVNAGNWYRDSPLVDKSQFVSGPYGGSDGGRITVGQGAVIDVSGSTGVPVDSSKNFVTLQLRGPELANSPLQRNSSIRAKNITIDSRITGTYDGQYWIGTPLGDATGYAALVQRSVGELTVAGGNITLAAGERVSLAADSQLNVSGGWVQYSGGSFGTTKLLTSFGTVVDISQARPDQSYARIIQNTPPVYESPYISGGGGGSLLIQAPSMDLGGSLSGVVVAGARQLRASTTTSALPSSSRLTLDVYSLRTDGGFESRQRPELIFTARPQSSADLGKIYLASSYFGEGGIGSLVVENNDGGVLLPRGINLTMAPMGELSLSASRLVIGGSLSVAGGKISLTAHDFSYDEIRAMSDAGTSPSMGNAAKGWIQIGEASVLSTAGVASSSLDPFSSPLVLDGGTISLAGYKVSLDNGSVLDVSGGHLLQSSGTVDYGDAGSISIAGTSDPSFGLLTGGALDLHASMRGYAGPGAKSGSLSLTAPAIRIGRPAAASGILSIMPDFFNIGGFASFSLTGIGIADAGGSLDHETPGIVVARDTLIHPAVLNRILRANGALSPILLPDWSRPAVSLSLRSPGIASDGLVAVRGSTVIEPGAKIDLDPQLSLSSRDSITPLGMASSLSVEGRVTRIDGLLHVPGGTISLTGARSYPDNYDPVLGASLARPTLLLGQSSRVSAAGGVFSMIDPLGIGRRIATVLPGGSVSLSGNIDLNPGSQINASGAYGSVSVPSALPGRSGVKPVSSDGGMITLAGSQYLVARGDLIGHAGGSSSSGGQLKVSSGTFYPLTVPGGIPSPSFDTSLIVAQGGESLVPTMTADSVAGISRGYFSIDAMSGGGFDRVNLSGNVGFIGSVSLSAAAAISLASGGVIRADQSVLIQAPYVSLGMPFAGPLAAIDGRSTRAFADGYSAPSSGTGALTVKARLVDIGNTLLKGISSVTIDAGSGDIRGDGTFAMAGRLDLRAGNLYPVTGTTFNLMSYDQGGVSGSIAVKQGGASGALPLSAGGKLSLYASSIMQEGTLLAPFGTINLGWDGTGSSPVDPITGAGITRTSITDPAPAVVSVPATSMLRLAAGSVTSVSAIDSLTGEGITIPYGVVVNGTQWIDPAGNDISGNGLTSKGVTLAASEVFTEAGSRIDLSGGGDLLAYHWVAGLQGTIDPAGQEAGSWSAKLTYAQGDRVRFNGAIYSARQESRGETPSVGLYWSKVNESYAVIPGYASDIQPFAPFGDTTQTAGDPGYVSPSLSVGDRITLSTGGGLAGGTYTLLPSRYALLPGAFLITPTGLMQDRNPSSVTLEDGSALVAGTRFSSLNAKGASLPSLYEVVSPSLLALGAEYQLSLASEFLPKTPLAAPVADAAGLVVKAPTSMNLLGRVSGSVREGARGSMIDLSSSRNFQIGGAAGPSTILLDAAALSSWKAGSLLIGGSRSITASGTRVTPTTSLVTLEKAASTLVAGDVILASKDGVILEKDSAIRATGDESADNLDVVGNGALLRVSSASGASVARSGSDAAAVQGYSIGEGASLIGKSVTLDSSGRGSVSGTAILDAGRLNLNAGKILVSMGAASGAVDALEISGDFLGGISRAKSLSLAARGGILFQGAGTFGSSSLGTLELHSSIIAGDNASAVTIKSGGLLIDNPFASTAGEANASAGSLTINTGILTMGSGGVAVTDFKNITINAASGIVGQGKGSFIAGGDLFLNTPLLTGAGAAISVIGAKGLLKVATGDSAPGVTPGLGASLTLRGNAITLEAPVRLLGGGFTAESTGIGQDLMISSAIDVGGESQNSFDAVRYIDAGEITLSSGGDVTLNQGASLSLDARPGGGDAGTLEVIAKSGEWSLSDGAALSAKPGASGVAGSLVADLGSYGAGDIGGLESLLTGAGFSLSQKIRLRNGNVTVSGAKAHAYSLTADSGSITVTGLIDASGETGGSIGLYAGQSVLIKEGAKLDASGRRFDAAGKGGSISLQAGNTPSLGSAGVAATRASGSFAGNAWVVDIGKGAVIDLTVDEVPGLGQSAGRLHLRAPQTADASDVQVNPIGGEIKGASVIGVEGVFRQDAAFDGIASIDSSAPSWNNVTSYKVGDTVLFNGQLYTAKKTGKNFTPPNTTFWSPSTDTSLKQKALDNASAFMGNADAISSRVLSAQPPNIASIFEINPGEEIVNSRGSLVLNNDWDLSLARYGRQLGILDASGNATGRTIAQGTGFLSLKAVGDITFNGSLSDGFGDSVNRAANAGGKNYGLYFAPLLPLLSTDPADPTKARGQSSWSYSIAAGKDFSSADPHAVGGTGSVNLGKPTKTSSVLTSSVGQNASTATIINGNYQVIRTGTGDISISAGGDIRLLNQFATIYTAGAQLTDPTLDGTFDPHTMQVVFRNTQRNNFGSVQQPALYPAQYSVGGGNVRLQAEGSIRHLQLSSDGTSYIADSSRQLPGNWLMRRGQTDATGQWLILPNGEVTSTSWWVDFSNFFQGVGALGGGNVSMLAGGNVSNVDAVIPTQALLTARDSSGIQLDPASGRLVETGGGDIAIKAGGNIDAGIYYVERGDATIRAGGDVISNRTRDVRGNYLYSLVSKNSSYANPAEETWLPTSFFLGKGGISVTARGDMLLGPVGNVFLLPQGLNLGVQYKNYFSTYGNSGSFSAASLGGDVTFRSQILGLPSFQKWLQSAVLGSASAPQSAGYYQPWLRLTELNPADSGLSAGAGLLPATFSLASLEGTISLQGNLTLSPSATGNLSLHADGGINGLYRQQSGVSWAYSSINVSDADPRTIPSAFSPLSQSQLNIWPALETTYLNSSLNYSTLTDYLAGFTVSLTETSSTEGSSAALQGKILRHDQGLLHRPDAEPVRIYSQNGDISGIELFAPKKTRILAGGDIQDVAFSIQQLSSSDFSMVSAGGDIIPYDANTLLRNTARKDLGANIAFLPPPLSGDIQINGPGTLAVIAGGDLDLGTGDARSDGTGVGITSIGNARNPALPFEGASLITAAGVAPAGGFGRGALTADAFLHHAAGLDRAKGYYEELKQSLGAQGDDHLLAGLTAAGSIGGIASSSLGEEEKARIALSLFYLVLRDSGRDHGNPDSPAYKTYRNGEDAIAAFLPPTDEGGDIVLNSRNIRTRSGGNVSMITPYGGISLASYAVGSSLAPPGIVTENGGSINIFSRESVTLGIGRIFTLRGGDILIWSDKGDIAAGASAKTVKSAPPTRVLLDPQSSAVKTDLAGLATGGGIGVLAAVVGVPPGNVDLIAPSGFIDAGDAGIRATGNLNLAAKEIRNADNILVGGAVVGAPPAATPASPPVVAPPSASAPVGATTAAAANNSAAEDAASNHGHPEEDQTPSIITVEVLGYGGGDGEDDERQAADVTVAPIQASL